MRPGGQMQKENVSPVTQVEPAAHGFGVQKSPAEGAGQVRVKRRGGSQTQA